MIVVEARINEGGWFKVEEFKTIREAEACAEGYKRGFRDGAGRRDQVETQTYELWPEEEEEE